MSKRPVIKASLIPTRRLPIYEVIIWLLVFDRFGAPGWLWWLFGVASTLWNLFILYSISQQEECEIDIKLPPQKMTFIPPDVPPGTR